jgi:hypothetical protein
MIMKTGFIFSALFAAGLLLNAQQSQTREVDAFDKITVFGSIDVTIEKGSKEGVNIESSSVDIDDINIKNDGLTLKISSLDKIFNNRRQIKIKITYRELRAVTLNGGAELSGRMPVKGDKIELKAGSGSVMNLDIEMNVLKVDVCQGATINLEGSCHSQEIEASTGGIFNAYEMRCDSSYVKANTGGLVKLKASSLLDATASMGGQISYRGEPKVKKEQTILGGTIEKTFE